MGSRNLTAVIWAKGQSRSYPLIFGELVRPLYSWQRRRTCYSTHVETRIDSLTETTLARSKRMKQFSITGPILGLVGIIGPCRQTIPSPRQTSLKSYFTAVAAEKRASKVLT